MNRQIHWIGALMCAVLITGCSTVEIVKPVNVSGSGIHLPVSSVVAFIGESGPLGREGGPLGSECWQALKAVEAQGSKSGTVVVLQLLTCLTQFETALEKALTDRGFTLSTDQDIKDALHIKIQAADCKLSIWQLYNVEGGQRVPQGQPSVGLNSVLFRIEYLDVKKQTLGVIQRNWYSSDSFEQPAKEVAEFTRKTFATKK